MDGFQPYQHQPGRVVALPLGRVTGGLNVRDFDAPVVKHDAAAEEAARIEQAERAERAAIMNASRAEGHAQGLAEGLRRAAEAEAARVAAALDAVAAAMADAGAAAQAAMDEASDELARLLLAALDASLPAASARLAAETATLLATTLRPVLEETHGLKLTVAAGLGEACAAAIGDSRIEVTEDPTLAPGDARAAWRGGSAAMELARQRLKVAEVLHALGLQG